MESVGVESRMKREPVRSPVTGDTSVRSAAGTFSSSEMAESTSET